MQVEQKQIIVDGLAQKLESATAVFLTDFTGLDVKGMTDLRARLRAAGVEYLVVKNTLARRALGDIDVPDIAEFFQGPTGLVIGREDGVTAAKILDEFARAHDARPTVKVGIVERRKLTGEQFERLAKLPAREQLLAELAGVMQAPVSQLAYALEAKLIELVGLIEALGAQRDQG